MLITRKTVCGWGGGHGDSLYFPLDFSTYLKLLLRKVYSVNKKVMLNILEKKADALVAKFLYQTLCVCRQNFCSGSWTKALMCRGCGSF